MGGQQALLQTQRSYIKLLQEQHHPTQQLPSRLEQQRGKKQAQMKLKHEAQRQARQLEEQQFQQKSQQIQSDMAASNKWFKAMQQALRLGRKPPPLPGSKTASVTASTTASTTAGTWYNS